MRFLFYKNNKLPTPWADNYKKLYKHELKKRNFSVQEITNINGYKGYLFLCHKEELERYKKEQKNINIKTIMQSNGTSMNIYDAYINPEEELSDLKLVDYNICASDEHRDALKNGFNISNVYTIGFPIQKFKKSKYRNIGRYCIAGRLTPDKLVYSSIELSLQDGAEEILICYPKNQKKYLKHYPKKDFIRYMECDEDKFLQVLSTCEKLVISSLGDVSSVVEVQARRMGLEILMQGQRYKSTFPYYYNNAERDKYYDVEFCVNNLIKILKNDL